MEAPTSEVASSSSGLAGGSVATTMDATSEGAPPASDTDVTLDEAGSTSTGEEEATESSEGSGETAGEGEPAAVCGDGVIEGEEECEDKNAVDEDFCTNKCRLPSCGDGIVGPGEVCDGGPLNSDSAVCTKECELAVCGDGLVRVGVEGCDDANTIDDDECTNACTLPKCGDGILQAGEQCDDGNEVDEDMCTRLCSVAKCGDGVVQDINEEQCDAGPANADESPCKSDCAFNVCGDGFVLPGVEGCDDGNSLDSDGCTNACELPSCGDGVVSQIAGEQCDDGNSLNDDACLVGCKLNVCGDGFLRGGVEVCDDGNTDVMDGCSAACTLESRCIVEASALGLAVPDDGYNGSLGSMTCVPLQCGKVGKVALGQVLLGMSHTFVGDLTIKLLAPGGGKFLTLMSRPGVAEGADNGAAASSNGDSSNIEKGFPVVFRDGGAKDAEAMGDSLASNTATVCKDDGACEYSPNKGASAASLDGFGGFAGTTSSGLWRVCVGDSQEVDTGAIDAVKLTLLLQ